MKRGQICEGIVERVTFPNKGIVTMQDGKKAVVKNVLPGQKISFSIHKVRKGRGEGRLLQVLERSPLELKEVPCEHFGICGGCTFLNLPYERQLELKEQQVRELLEPVCEPYGQGRGRKSFVDIFEGVKKSPRQFAYRNKMEFSFGDSVKDGPLSLGMHKRGSFHDIVTVSGCKIVDKDFSDILLTVLTYFQEQGIAYYHKMRHTGYLRHLLVRKAAKTEEILVDLVTTSQITGEEQNRLLEGLKEILLRLHLEGKIVGILHTLNDSLADAVINQGTSVLYGQEYFYEEILGLRFRISPFSFFQTNSLGAEVLYETVREFVADAGDGRVIYDLYSGTGTIAQILASVAEKVIGVEIVEEAVEAAEENARLNGLCNCKFLAGDVLKVLEQISVKPDFIVLDPPRDGIHPKALERIISYGVDKMVYISCKPTSLARDLEILQIHGYMVERVCCVDMFPQTTHVETCVLLSQKKADDYVEVSLELGEDDITPAEKKATYREIKDYVFDKYGAKVSSLNISQIKRKNGLQVGESYNKPKTSGARVPNCPPEKERYIEEAFFHFQMV
ncbi:23S rRNA (uracil(1939)-C(5))-methyltransferase RlmD [Lachnospiraceae bacterium 45-W7]